MIQTYPAVNIGLIICMGMLIFILYEHQLKKLALQGIVGVLCILGVNALIPEVYEVSMTTFNMVMVAVLGLPGVVLAYLIQIFMMR